MPSRHPNSTFRMHMDHSSLNMLSIHRTRQFNNRNRKQPRPRLVNNFSQLRYMLVFPNRLSQQRRTAMRQVEPLIRLPCRRKVFSQVTHARGNNIRHSGSGM